MIRGEYFGWDEAAKATPKAIVCRTAEEVRRLAKHTRVVRIPFVRPTMPHSRKPEPIIVEPPPKLTHREILLQAQVACLKVIEKMWVGPRAQRAVTVTQIKHEVCRHYGLTITQLMAKRRTRDITRPRQVAMYLAKEFTVASLPAIGRRFGGMDHTTVLHAGRKITELMQSDEKIREDVTAIQRRLAR